MSIKGQGHSLTLAEGHSDIKIKSCFFNKIAGSFETKFRVKAYGSTGMKICTNCLGHMTKMAAVPIYGKTHQKPSPEPVG